MAREGADPVEGGARRPLGRNFFLGAVLVALLLAGVVSFYASSSPDGLERVAEDTGLIEAADDHALAESPLADYGVAGVEDERLSVGLSGLVGVGITLGVGMLVFGLVRRRGTAPEPEPDERR
ncbi:PDGLE domain-containing protein [Allonocardiopsis opalescens]|uniref:PDGLE domain-containing protein n=1 Tax=Allonocardiopsis opalescens TaxID=1144618 RepID=A0A2T0PX80_9ACTN|nr:PDGLE domain-containing protein [Allonocardiopsis opalescens]PRX96142.1 PDGLE domain-containing protein [Allonocardiopsis opalescens]